MFSNHASGSKGMHVHCRKLNIFVYCHWAAVRLLVEMLFQFWTWDLSHCVFLQCAYKLMLNLMKAYCVTGQPRHCGNLLGYQYPSISLRRMRRILPSWVHSGLLCCRILHLTYRHMWALQGLRRSSSGMHCLHVTDLRIYRITCTCNCKVN